MSTAGNTKKVDRGTADSSRQGEHCAACGVAVPLRAARPEELTAHWECASCRTPATGVLVKDAAPLLAAHIHLGQQHFDVSTQPPIPAALRRLVQEFAALRRPAKQPHDERRQSVRVPQQLDVVIVPLNESWAPLGKAIQGIVVDLAQQGLGMVTAEGVAAPYVVAQIRHGGALVQLLGKLAWSKEIHADCHHAGVQFVVRLGRKSMR